MDFSLPPRDVPPERLFRLLLRRPRPVLPLAFRLPFAPEVALSVRGLTAAEDAEVADVDPALPPEVRRSERLRRVIAASLLADGRLAFASAEDVGALTEYETTALANAVLQGVHVISPQYRIANTEAWTERLTAGAKHPANISAALAIHMSTTGVFTPRGIVREAAPDRYFGLPFADLTDGHLLAYAAAKAVFEKT